MGGGCQTVTTTEFANNRKRVANIGVAAQSPWGVPLCSRQGSSLHMFVGISSRAFRRDVTLPPILERWNFQKWEAWDNRRLEILRRRYVYSLITFSSFTVNSFNCVMLLMILFTLCCCASALANTSSTEAADCCDIAATVPVSSVT